ncbi:sugar phosphate isomerase/epimerase family protein [Fimbriiglobus ruber]|uniref:Xylose isomerase n=1 Tax=Fimbriiglobus ruber TaxID=1908690 RepID=A0A225EB46_9BACT|nr:sugar phosphate isomerase/epimerase [Fimbriiglobus ruber]OWK47256.1 xylose isomerase [Fimbriiglobus ruber]
MSLIHTAVGRREFLRASALTAGAALFAGRSHAAAADESFGGFTVGIQSYTFRKFTLEQALKKTQEAGLPFAEFYNGHIPVNSSPEKIAGIKKLCTEYGITPIAFGVEHFSKKHDDNKKKFEFGALLGIKYLSADPDPDSFDSLDKLVDEYKIAIAIHPHGPVGGGKMHRWSSAEFIMKALKDHSPLIGTCLDTGHLIRSAQIGVNLDPVQQIKVMGARNFGLHLKDHDNKRKTDVPYGDPTGVLDVAGVLKALKEVKFGGYISIEYEANESNPSDDVKKCVAYFKDTVKKIG